MRSGKQLGEGARAGGSASPRSTELSRALQARCSEARPVSPIASRDAAALRCCLPLQCKEHVTAGAGARVACTIVDELFSAQAAWHQGFMVQEARDIEFETQRTASASDLQSLLDPSGIDSPRPLTCSAAADVAGPRPRAPFRRATDGARPRPRQSPSLGAPSGSPGCLSSVQRPPLETPAPPQ